MTDTELVDQRPTWQLPTEAYRSRDWYEREQVELFGNTWQWVGTERDLAEVGSFLTTQIGNEPVVVARAEPGRLTAHINICRHRGMELACGSGKVDGSFRCPYHWWEFDLDGRLTRVPQRRSEFSDIDLEQFGLVDVAVDTWRGHVFVNVGQDPEPFADYLCDFEDHIGDYPYEDLRELHSVRIPTAANWKLIVENHIDILHLFYLHPFLTEYYDNPNFQHRFCGPHWTSWESLKRNVEPPPDAFHPIPGLSDEESRLVRANLIFPNTLFNTHGNSTSVFRVVPTGPETCEIELHFYGTGMDDSDDALESLLTIVRDEDAWAAEQMQAVIGSSHWSVGPLARRWEAPIAWFQGNVLDRLGGV
jgi:Rieske 2Fe-2S family protein